MQTPPKWMGLWAKRRRERNLRVSDIKDQDAFNTEVVMALRNLYLMFDSDSDKEDCDFARQSFSARLYALSAYAAPPYPWELTNEFQQELQRQESA